MQAKFVSHFSSRHGIGKILFVGEDKQDGFFQFVFVEHPVEFISGSINTVSIVGIDNENQALCILIVVSPQRSDLILSSYIPYSEANILLELKNETRNERVRRKK